MNRNSNYIKVRDQIHEIQQYRHVLSRLLGYQVSLGQAIDDWIAHGFHQNGPPPGLTRSV